VAAHGERQLLGRDAAAVVLDEDQLAAAAPEGHGDPPGAGVERVLDQLLDHGSRPLDHFTGGDPVDDLLGKDADRGQGRAHPAGRPSGRPATVTRSSPA